MDAVTIRALRSSDRDLVRMILERLGPQSRLQRFLGPKPMFSQRDISAVTDLDGWDRAGVIAVTGSTDVPIGAAHYVRTEEAGTAEIAIEVADEWQRRGVGRALIDQLRAQAQRADIRRLEWYAFGGNRAMAAATRDLVVQSRVHVGGGVFKSSATIG